MVSAVVPSIVIRRKPLAPIVHHEPSASCEVIISFFVDGLARREPDKLAMVHVANDGTERRFTFKDMKDASSQAANYFTSLGVKRDDRVMLVLKRHYQFWFAILGLHKLGATAIPATNQLMEHDFTYRFKAAGVSAIVCTADGDTAHQVDIAEADTGVHLTKVLVGGKREGWHDFDAEYGLFSRRYTRTADAPCGDDPMLMFFTSGTTGPSSPSARPG